MSDNYEKALDDAQKELAELEVRSAKIEQRKAQLEQTIIGLKALMRVDSGAEDRSLTDGIRLVLKASDRYMSVQEVLEQLRMIYPNLSTENKLNSVTTLLNRMAKDEEIVQGNTEEGRVGYTWNRIPKSFLQILGIGGTKKLTDEIMKMSPRTRRPSTPVARDTSQRMHPPTRRAVPPDSSFAAKAFARGRREKEKMTFALNTKALR
jgi:Fe2+ or Zn2+ uptake regulation protein